VNTAGLKPFAGRLSSRAAIVEATEGHKSMVARIACR
jgi:hypothetical protein